MKYLLITLFILSPLAVQAGSTALTPAKFVVPASESLISETITISNLSGTSQFYNLGPEDPALANIISVVPEKFVLGPNQTAQAVVRIKPAAESWRANLNLVAYNASQMRANFRIGDGIKIPIFFNAPQVLGQSVKITGVTAYFWLLTLLIFSLALSVLGVVFYLYYRHTFWRQIRARHKISFL